jgi:hypothetical protein
VLPRLRNAQASRLVLTGGPRPQISDERKRAVDLATKTDGVLQPQPHSTAVVGRVEFAARIASSIVARATAHLPGDSKRIGNVRT